MRAVPPRQLHAPSARQRAIECIRECLLFLLPVSAVAARFDTTAAQSVHEIPDGQALTNALLGVDVAARIDDDHSFRNQESGKRNIRSHRNITRLGMLGDIQIGNVGAAIYADGREVGVASRQLYPLVRNENGVELQAVGCPEAQILHVARCGVSVDPQFQGESLSSVNVR